MLNLLILYEMMHESFESEKLERLISDKKAYLSKLTNDTARKHLQAEIIFLQDEILPIVLRSTTLLHGEIVRYTTRCTAEAVAQKCNGLLLYIPLWSDYKERPLIGRANCKQYQFEGNPIEGCIEIYCNQVEVLNLDGSGVNNMDIFILDIDGNDT
jgi:hypothetical protein